MACGRTCQAPSPSKRTRWERSEAACGGFKSVSDVDFARRCRLRLGLGENTFDIYLNSRAYWRNIRVAVWEYRLGGYQVLKKWLFYRSRPILGRDLKPEEASYFAEAVRRIADALLDGSP